ncbi:hypothetical protein [Fluviicola sp.]|uniref:hypothetical protein n=1 Tax=Fluviicola sp. TaxID=1917219 RepID=UPI003D2CAF6C
MKYIYILLLFFIIINGCGTSSWQQFYPNVSINPTKFKHNLPITYEDCLLQFDSILTPEVVSHYRIEDSTVAYIKIAQEMGGLFTNFWNLPIIEISK